MSFLDCLVVDVVDRARLSPCAKASRRPGVSLSLTRLEMFLWYHPKDDQGMEGNPIREEFHRTMEQCEGIRIHQLM